MKKSIILFFYSFLRALIGSSFVSYLYYEGYTQLYILNGNFSSRHDLKDEYAYAVHVILAVPVIFLVSLICFFIFFFKKSLLNSRGK